MPDCMADDAVRREPRFGLEFPVIREKYRELKVFGPDLGV